MKIKAVNLCRYFLTLLVVLPWYSHLSAQTAEEDGQFYLGFAGSAVFPYDPRGPSGPASAGVNFASGSLAGSTAWSAGHVQTSGSAGVNFEAGAGFTAAFGYAFKEGFSTEIEWGYQKAGIGAPTANLFQNTDFGGSRGVIGGIEDFPLLLPQITIEVDGAIKTQSLMGNFYYRYPKWRVSPYAGFGLGYFFHDGTFTSTINIETDLFAGVPNIIVAPALETLSLPSLETTITYDDSRFAYQIMVGLSARASQLVEFRLGYRFRSSRGEPIDADQIEAGLRFRF